ncbi:hypothetical protein SISSUDRAFT_965805, partial [Sistotremastrum suecicum HHB10207 ss-3]
APPIPGLFFDQSIRLPHDLCTSLYTSLDETYFSSSSSSHQTNQIMLFGRAGSQGYGLPPLLETLLASLSTILRPHLDDHTYALLFPPNPQRARQAIINMYDPGEGISPHVDLLRRFGDGIIGISLGSGCAMQFVRVATDDGEDKQAHELYLPEGSVLVLTGDARYHWAHGIEGRLADDVSTDQGIEKVERRRRISVTLRWLLEGADIVG